MPPRVSVLLPNLNNRPYLDERLQTIVNQTYTDWELIIIDNYSDDGAWELFQEWAGKDARIKISQAPRNGMYANWNNCIRQAQGDFIYIATSDDTMEPELLDVMVTALTEYHECDLAHCKIRIIDESGEKHPSLLWDNFPGIAYFGDLINKKHIRLAPHDGFLHCGVKTVYTSITQLLIRKSLFDRIGLFLTDYGSIADFEWEMRASLIANTIHIPEYLATWRVHTSQGTDHNYLKTPKHRAHLLELIDHALSVAGKINPALLQNTRINSLKELYKKEKFQLEIGAQKNTIDKYKVGLSWLFKNPFIMLKYFIRSKVFPKPCPMPQQAMEFSRRILTRHNCINNIKLVD